MATLAAIGVLAQDLSPIHEVTSTMKFPPELLNQIGVVLEIVVAIVVALTVAFWVGFAVWTFRDIRLRTRDVFAWILATLLVLALGPIGLLLYMLLRPKETLAEIYDRQLEEEALLRDITTRRACPECQTVTEPDWVVCPHCRAELRRPCTNCGKVLELNWVTCPYCATSTGARPIQRPEHDRVYEPEFLVVPAAPTGESVAAQPETR